METMTEGEALQIVMVGYGNRARTYADYLRRTAVATARPGCRVVAIVEPNPIRRTAALTAFGLSPEAGFADWEAYLAASAVRIDLQGVQAAIVTTPDHQHYGIALSALQERGYHVLLEKPIAQSYRECLDIARVAQEESLAVPLADPAHGLGQRRQLLARHHADLQMIRTAPLGGRPGGSHHGTGHLPHIRFTQFLFSDHVCFLLAYAYRSSTRHAAGPALLRTTNALRAQCRSESVSVGSSGPIVSGRS